MLGSTSIKNLHFDAFEQIMHTSRDFCIYICTPYIQIFMRKSFLEVNNKGVRALFVFLFSCLNILRRCLQKKRRQAYHEMHLASVDDFQASRERVVCY